MTTSDARRLSMNGLTALPDRSADGPDGPDVLRRLQDSALGLLAGLDRQPRSLRIKADGAEIEVEWPEPVVAAGQQAAAVAVAESAAAAPAESGSGRHVCAHMVGVFYRAPEPGAKPFVEPGDVVVPGQQLGIIEAMKLMIPVEADAPGRIVEVLAADGTSVEYGDRLFAFEPVDS